MVLTHPLKRPLSAPVANVFGLEPSQGDTPAFQATYEAFASTAQSADDTGITIAKPTGTAEGDLLVAIVSRGDGNSVPGSGAPTGWNELILDNVVGAFNFGNALSVWWKEAGSSEPTDYTFTYGTTSRGAGQIIRFSNANTTEPFIQGDITPAENSASILAASLTIDEDLSNVLYLFSTTNTSRNISAQPIGLTPIENTEPNSDTTCGWLVSYYKEEATATTTDNKSLLLNGNNYSQGLQLAVRGAPAVPEAPANSVAPTVSGDTSLGDTLTATTGTWSGYPTPSFSYQWRRDTVNISGATSSTYDITLADDDASLDCVITATNSEGSASEASSNQIAVDDFFAPTNSVAPVASGSTSLGDTLSVTNGTWSADPAISGYTYQWRRGGVNISGAVANTYTIVEADDNATLDCVVTATNPVDSTSQDSNDISVDDFYAPTNSVAPAITGNTGLGDELSVTTGTWDASPAVSGYTYQWKRNGANISGETSNTYTIVLADDNANITCEVTATNAIGSTAQISNTVAVDDFTVPSITGVPTISGTEQVGQTLTATAATTSGNPTPTRTWQWERSGSTIAGATSSTYELVEADEGETITVVQTETNALGTDNAESAATGTIQPEASTILHPDEVEVLLASSAPVSQLWTGEYGLMSFYQGDDSSTEANDPTYNSTANAESFQFDGDDIFTANHVSDPSVITTAHQTGGKIALAFLFKTQTTNSNNIMYLMANRLSTSGFAITMRNNGASSLLNLALENGSGGSVTVSAGSPTFPTNDWVFLGISWDIATGERTLYNSLADAIQQDSFSFTSDTSSPQSDPASLVASTSGTGLLRTGNELSGVGVIDAYIDNLTDWQSVRDNMMAQFTGITLAN